jgi:hypothetical protein
MSKFFTSPLALLLACVFSVLASEEMTLTPPAPDTNPAEGAPTAATALPASLSAGRFAPLTRKSPFTLASTTEENADFAKDLVLAGYVRMDGQDFVMIANRTRPDRLMVGTKPSPSAQGMVLLKVERDPSGDPTKLRAQIRKGTETAMLKYESAAPGAVPPPGQPGAAQPVAGQVAPGQPAVPGQPQAGQPLPGAPGQKPAQNPPVIRRRVIPIPPPISR